MKKACLVSLATAFLVRLISMSCGHTPTDDNAEVEWTKTFGGSGPDGVTSVQQISDVGDIIAGSTHSYGAGEADVWLIKIVA